MMVIRWIMTGALIAQLMDFIYVLEAPLLLQIHVYFNALMELYKQQKPVMTIT
jgi:hypothetical protein